MKTLADVKQIDFPKIGDEESYLCIFEAQKLVPFPIQRVFTVTAKTKVRRGTHAHKECQQLIICLQGEATITIDDGQNKKVYTLKNPGAGIFIPASLWAIQDYQADTMMVVLTDQLFAEADYIRDYDAFLDYRKKS